MGAKALLVLVIAKYSNFKIVVNVWKLTCDFFSSAEPLPLMDLCRRTIRQQVGKANIERGRVEELNVPKAIRDYLQYKDRR